MKNQIKKQILLILIFFIVFIGYSQTDYYPKRNQAQSQNKYDYYLDYLKKAYLRKDYFDVGLSFSNLYVNSDTVFKYIDKGIKDNNKKCKSNIYLYYEIYKSENFKVKLVKIDSTKFINSFNLCLSLLGENSYEEHLLMKKTKAKQKKLALMKDVDTTKLDQKLISELKQIFIDDQKYRNNHQKQKILDEINFNKIDKILLNGYPTPKDIGVKQLFTIWLVLQHQPNYKKRLHYIPLLEKALNDNLISDSQLYEYKRRTEKIQKFSKKGN